MQDRGGSGFSVPGQLAPEARANQEPTQRAPAVPAAKEAPAPSPAGLAGSTAPQGAPGPVAGAAAPVEAPVSAGPETGVHGPGGGRSAEEVSQFPTETAKPSMLAQKNEVVAPSPTLQLTDTRTIAPNEAAQAERQSTINQQRNVQNVELSPGGQNAVAAIQERQTVAAAEVAAKNVALYEEFTRHGGVVESATRAGLDYLGGLAANIGSLPLPSIGPLVPGVNPTIGNALGSGLGALTAVFDALRTPVGAIALAVDSKPGRETGLTQATAQAIVDEAARQGRTPDDPLMVAQYGKIATDVLMNGLGQVALAPSNMGTPEQLVAGATWGIYTVLTLGLGFGPGLKALKAAKEVPAMADAVQQSPVAMRLVSRAAAAALSGKSVEMESAARAAVYAASEEAARVARSAGAGKEAQAALAIERGRNPEEAIAGVTGVDDYIKARQAEIAGAPSLTNQAAMDAYRAMAVSKEAEVAAAAQRATEEERAAAVLRESIKPESVKSTHEIVNSVLFGEGKTGARVAKAGEGYTLPFEEKAGKGTSLLPKFRVAPVGGGRAGQFDAVTNTITIDAAFKKEFGLRGVVPVAAHELIHAAQFFLEAKRSVSAFAAIDDIERLPTQVQRVIANLIGIIPEGLRSPEFRAAWKDNLKEHIVNLIHGMAGGPRGRDYLDRYADQTLAVRAGSREVRALRESSSMEVGVAQQRAQGLMNAATSEAERNRIHLDMADEIARIRSKTARQIQGIAERSSGVASSVGAIAPERGPAGGLKWLGKEVNASDLTKEIQKATGGVEDAKTGKFVGARINGIVALGEAIRNGHDLTGVPESVVAQFIGGFVQRALVKEGKMTEEQVARITSYAAKDVKNGATAVEATQKAVADELLANELTLKTTGKHEPQLNAPGDIMNSGARGTSPIHGEGGEVSGRQAPMQVPVQAADRVKITTYTDAKLGQRFQATIDGVVYKDFKTVDEAQRFADRNIINQTLPDIDFGIDSPLRNALRRGGASAEQDAWVANPENKGMVQGVLGEAAKLPDEVKGKVASGAVRAMAADGAGGEGSAIAEFGRWAEKNSEAGPLHWKSVLFRSYIVNDLIGPGIAFVKTFTDSTWAVVKTADIVTKPLFSWGLKAETGFKDVPDELKVWFGAFGPRGIGDRFIGGVRSAKYGIDVIENPATDLDRIRKGDAGRVGQGVATAMDVLTLGMTKLQPTQRIISGVTGLFGGAYRDVALFRAATREAKAAGKVGEEGEKFVRDFLKAPPTSEDELAWDIAKREVFTNRSDMPGVAQLSDFRKLTGSPMSNAAFGLFPFVSTMANITARGFEFVPGLNVIGLLRASGSPAQVAAQRAHAVYGLIGSVILCNHAFAGNLTGDGPSDTKARIALLQKDWKPNSIKLGDVWVENRNFGPLAVLLNVIGNYHDNLAYNTKEKDKDQVVTHTVNIVKSVLQSLGTEEHFIDQMKALATLTSPDATQKDYEDLAISLGSEFVPNVGALKTAEGMEESRTPHVRSGLPADEHLKQRFERMFPPELRESLGAPKIPQEGGVKRPYSGLGRLTGIEGGGPSAPSIEDTGVPPGGF